MTKRDKQSDEQAVTSARKHGNTWWGRRWIATLEQGSRDMVARLGKGRAYARDGYVHGLEITSGRVHATVTDDELENFEVTLKLDIFDDVAWQRILQAMGAQALNAAQLLNGEMPRDIDQVFRSCGKSLFPVDHHEIDADCSCEDWTSPCKHVAATHYVLGDALDHDPFLLFELRGRSKEQVLDALDRLRLAKGPNEVPVEIRQGESGDPGSLPMTALSSHDFEHSEVALPGFSFNFDHEVVQRTGASSLLQSLGKPAHWPVAASPQELLEPALMQARQLALTLASGSGHIPLKQATKHSAAGKKAKRAKLSRTDHEE